MDIIWFCSNTACTCKLFKSICYRSILCFIILEHHGEVVTQNNAFFYMWVISAVIATIYTIIWDLKMDWGLFDKEQGDNRFLREEIVYASKVSDCCVENTIPLLYNYICWTCR